MSNTGKDNTGKRIGYIRVSTKEQNTDRQLNAMLEYGINEEDIYIDKASGKNFNRESYQLLKQHVLRSGDVLIIKELDRLGRDMEQIKEEWNSLQKMGINIEVIDTPMLNTANKTDLEKTLINNIVMELLTYMAQKERIKILNRSREGMDAMPVNPETGKKKSLKTGKDTGRPVAKMPSNLREVYERVFIKKEITAVKGMELTGLTRCTFYKFKKLIDEERAERGL